MPANTKALPVVDQGEDLQQWLSRAVPALVEQRGLEQSEAQNLATQAWEQVNGTAGAPTEEPAAAEDAPPADAPPPKAQAEEPAPEAEDDEEGWPDLGDDEAEEAPPAAEADEEGWPDLDEDEAEPEETEEAPEDEAEWGDDETWGESYTEGEDEAPQAEDDEDEEEEEEDKEEDDAEFMPAIESESEPEEDTEGDAEEDEDDGWGDWGESEDEEDAEYMPAMEEEDDLDAEADAEAADDEDWIDWDETEEDEADYMPALEESAEEDVPAEEDDWLDWADEDDGETEEAQEAPAGIVGWMSAQIQEYATTLADALISHGQLETDQQQGVISAITDAMTSFVTSAETRNAPAGDLMKSATLLTYLEAEIHRNFTVVADGMRSNGNLTREERIALSHCIGDALDAFVSAATSSLPDAMSRSPYVDIEQAGTAPALVGRPTAVDNNLPSVTADPSGEEHVELTFVTELPSDEEMAEMAKTWLVETMKGGPGSGYHGPRPGLPGVWGGSRPRGGAAVADRPAQRRNSERDFSFADDEAPWDRESDSLMEKVKAGGFTYEPIDQSSPTTGYAVSPYPDREYVKALDELTVDDIEKYIVDNADLWDDPETKLGGWYDEEAGMVYLDVSVVADSPERAQELCEEHGQEGYYDLEKGETVIVKSQDERRFIDGKTALFVFDPSTRSKAERGPPAEGTQAETEEGWLDAEGFEGPIVKSALTSHPQAINPAFAIKSLSNNRVGGYLCLWGNTAKKDISGEFFTPDTEELTGVYKSIGAVPCIYHHAMDDTMKSTVVGVVDRMESDDVGLWIEAQIQQHEAYRKFIEPLVSNGMLGWSSGTLPGARRVNKSTGEITRWPVIEASMTPTPAEWRMAAQWPVQNLKAAYERAGLDDDTTMNALKSLFPAKDDERRNRN